MKKYDFLNTAILIMTFLFYPGLYSDSPSDGHFVISRERIHQEIIDSSQYEYEIFMGGTADMDNTLFRTHGNIIVGFQNNVSLVIENTGENVIKDPEIIINGRGDWGSVEGILKEAFGGSEDPQDRLKHLWWWLTKHRYHELPMFPRTDSFDPVKMYCIYGQGMCGQQGFITARLAWEAGFAPPREPKPPLIRYLGGHVQGEIFHENDYQFLDSDQECFYLDRDNKTIISGDDVVRDRDLARRETHYGPLFKPWYMSDHVATLFGSDDSHGVEGRAKNYEIIWNLHPGEKIIYRWDNIGKYVTGYSEEKRNKPPHFYGNSKVIYHPRLELSDCKPSVVHNCDLKAVKSAMFPFQARGRESDSFLVFEIRSPFAMCGGNVIAEFSSPGALNRAALYYSEDARKWSKLDECIGKGDFVISECLDRFQHRRPLNGSPAYRYYIKVDLSSGNSESGLMLKDIRFETDLMAAPLYLPRLKRGRNIIRYTDASGDERSVKITQNWIESDNLKSPDPPEFIFPENNDVLTQSVPEFKWEENSGSRYYFQISEKKDFSVPYRPCFNLIINNHEWKGRCPGLFNTDTDYYARVKAFDKKGIWSEWSRPVKFRWKGPHPPVDVSYQLKDNNVHIKWKPDAKGAKPVKYMVYGSDQQGFSLFAITKDEKMFAKKLGETEELQMMVSGFNLKGDGSGKAYYRVVAVDENGTESGPSHYVQAPVIRKNRSGR